MSDTIQSAEAQRLSDKWCAYWKDFWLKNRKELSGNPGELSDTIQSAEEFAGMIYACLWHDLEKKAREKIESRDAAIRADEARKQAECVEALKEVIDGIDPYGTGGDSFHPHLFDRARKALADLEDTK
jgi:hypothetical protein